MAADPSYPDSELAKMIRTARIRKGMSHARLGAVVDRTATTVRRWERGELAPPDDVLPVIGRALDLDPEQLIRAAHGPDAHVVVPTPAAKAMDAGAAAEADDGAEEPPSAAPKPIRPGIALIPPEEDAPEGEIAVVGSDDDEREAPWFDVSDQQIKTASPSTASPTPAAQPDEPTVPKADLPPVPSVPVVPVIPAATAAGKAQATTSMSEATQPVATTLAPPQAVAVVPAPALQQLPSYVEDPRERWRYVFRAILTIVILVIMAYVLLWATGEFLGLFDDVFQDTFTDPTPDITTTIPLP